MNAHLAKAAFVVVCIAVGTQIGLWAIDTQPPYEWDGPSSRVVPDPAPDGGRVTADWHLKVNRICPAISQRRLSDPATRRIDSEGNPIPHSGKTVATYDATPGAVSVQVGENVMRRTFVLPRGLPSQVAYASEVCFQCNPLQTIFPRSFCLTTPELIFNVVASYDPPVAEPSLMEPK